MYALNLDNNNRVVSVTYPEYATDSMPLVEEVPENHTDYLYIDGKFVHSPEKDPPKPTPEKPKEGTSWADMASAMKEGVNSV